LTLALPTRLATGTSVGLQARPLTRPGLFEQGLVVLTTFVFVHQIPNAWLRTRSDALEDPGNPQLVVLELALTAFAFARVAGSIDHLITMVRLEPTVYLYAGLVFSSTFWSASPIDTVKRAMGPRRSWCWGSTR
jgi:hypothetical protein